MKITTQEIEVGGKTLYLEHGRFAEQANSAIVARLGDTMVLVTVVAAPLKMELDYFPLTVDYMLKMYAGGRIKGSRWVKREGRPTDEEILTCRLIDRSIRPLFPKAYKKEVQVMATVLSVDGENDPAVLAMTAASAAIATSDLPWKGPVGSLRIGAREGSFLANPTDSELKDSDLDLVLTATREKIFMIEAGLQQVSESLVLESLAFALTEAGKIIAGIEALVKKVGKTKEKFDDSEDVELASLIEKKFGTQILDYAKANASKEGGADNSELKNAIIAAVGEAKAVNVASSLEKVLRKLVRKQILSGSRLDGRKHDQIRELTCEVGILPRTHGSAMFRRGQTQVLSVATLGAPNLSQLLETAEGEETKRYIHHYSMPPFSSGETGRVGAPNRREIGHGALAERALMPVIPAEGEFPYTIQVVSEVMSSNGSTSMASTCGSTLSLMDAGVPITAPVSGIAMGLIIDEGKIAILSDIMGIEDGMGDMDFKVTGTEKGITAIQLDVKTPDLTLEILKKALDQGKKGRMSILEAMVKALPNARQAVSPFAPKIVQTKVPVEKIGEIIGPGGKVIKRIMAETGAQIDVEDDGSVTLSGVDQESIERAKSTVEGIVKEVQPGEIYDGEVVRIQPFGAFVNILPGKDGLVHVSDMAEGFVQDPADVVKEGDKVKVRVREVDNLGRINLSMRMDPATDKPREERSGGQRFDSPRFAGGAGRRGEDRGPRRFGGPDRGPRRFGSPRFGEAGDRDRGPRRDDSPRSGYGGDRRGPRRERSEGTGGFTRRRSPQATEGGPHFPASRFMPSKKRF